MFDIWRIEKGNVAGSLAWVIECNARNLPPALPWVEPSINNLWLEACGSYLYGNYQASILTTSVLLELTLRIVSTDQEDVPSFRDDYEKLFQTRNLSAAINRAKQMGLLEGDSKKWWAAYCKHIRNKICHGDLLHILDECRSVEQFADYFESDVSRENYDAFTYDYIITNPASFHHKYGRRFSKHFLQDAYRELNALIQKTTWCEYNDWWESQKCSYESFFAYKWNYSTFKQGVERAVKSR